MGIGDKIKQAFSKSDKDEYDHSTGTTGNTGTSAVNKAEQRIPGQSSGQGGAVNKAEQSAAGHLPGKAGEAARAEQAASHIPGGSSRTTGTGGQGTVGRAEQAVESHLPGHKGHTGTGTGTGSGSYSQGTGGNQGYTNQGSGVSGTGNQGYTNQGSGISGSGGSGRGYQESGSGVTGGQGQGYGTGSGTTSYQVGNQSDIDNRRGDMSNIVGGTPSLSGHNPNQLREELAANYDREPWHEAIKKTDLAEKEVATAAMQADQANSALAQAQRAQQSMNKHASEHDRLLAEAERQRGLVTDPDNLRSGLNSAQGDLTDAQRAAAEHNRRLKDADAAYAAKRGELDGLAPRVQAHDQKLQGLAGEYDNAVAKRDAVAADADRLRNQALEAERNRGGIASTVEQLMEKLRLAEEEMVANERAFLQSRDNHRSLHDQLRRARGELDGVNAQYEKNAGAADAALQSAHGWDDKTAQLRNRLQEHESEHNRLLDLINRLKAELEAMLAELEGLRRHGQPNKQAIEDAELRVSNQRNQLREAEARAKDAEARYRQLVKEADSHKGRAADAANIANRQAGAYEGKMQEAQLHGDRHVQLWNEAQQAGTTGSTNATSAFEKLKQKVETFGHREP